ncbi:MAG TPA: Npt1/Npt2 family nucleotide transporter [Polyangia bacterium]|nr:Npt1/Npt2 family nucleotide transporter [Polyangia bacterium]
MIAAVCAATMIAQQVGGKATRDALFLGTFGITALPTMLIVAAVFSVVIIPVGGRALTALGPSRLVPPLFAASALLTIGEWGLFRYSPRAAAVLVYLHIGSIGSLLISWFWSLINERFDPRTAKRQMGRIAGGASLGGLVGGLVAARLARSLGPSGMLPLLAGLHLGCAVFSMGVRTASRPRAAAPRADEEVTEKLAPGPPAAEKPAPPPRAGLSILWRSSYLRDLALLVSLGAIGAALLDYVFKAQASSAVARGAPLLRFFAIFYTATSLMTFLVQTTVTRRLLERLGLARTAASLPVTLGLGSVAALVAPSLGCVAIARGAEATVRSSLFRSGYELFYMPVAPDQKRAAKAMIDVGGERLGDLAGGGLVKLVLFVVPARSFTVLVGAALALAAAGLAITWRLRQGYVRTLERSLLDRAGALELDGSLDPATRDVLSRTRQDVWLTDVRALAGRPALSKTPAASASPLPPVPAPPPDPELARLHALRSGDRDRVRATLAEPLLPTLVPTAIALLGWDEVADAALAALRHVAPAVIGQLSDALLDPQTEFVIRRRLPRVLAFCTTPRAAEALWAGLADSRFEVRYQCGRALARMHDHDPSLQMPEERVRAAVLREVAVDRKVWEGRRLLDQADGSDDDSPFVHQFLRDRANRSLEHVFTLLALAWPPQPLIVAFRGLHTSDEALRGTALEYLEGLLPEPIRVSLWPFLEDRREARHPPRARAEILADLMRSNATIELNLKQLREQLARAGTVPPPGRPRT